jgi:hypothetical protein
VARRKFTKRVYSQRAEVTSRLYKKILEQVACLGLINLALMPQDLTDAHYAGEIENNAA